MINDIITACTIWGDVPSKANTYIAVKGRIVKGDKVRAYEMSFASQWFAAVKDLPIIDYPFALRLRLYTSTQRRDIDNAIKTLLDCLQQVGAVIDDNLCMELHATKVVDRHARADIALCRLGAYTPSLFGGGRH